MRGTKRRDDTMKYFDRIYGKVEIDDPLALEIIASAPFQRLKYIDTGGYRPLYINPKQKFRPLECSRYNHSVGVYLLLKKYDAPREDQIAGLLHDISHHAFSHCSEYALEESIGAQDLQDRNHDNFVKKSIIPKILKKYNISLSYIMDEQNFPLSETKLPDICADRIDYSMRDIVKLKEISTWEGRDLFKKLKAIKGRWIFDDFESAKRFADYFALMNDKYYASFGSGAMFSIIGDYLKYALEKGYIREADFWKTDKEVIKIVNKYLHKDLKLSKLWRIMNGKANFSDDKNNYDRRLLMKSRVVDPLFIAENGDIIKVSDRDPKWGEIVKRELKPKEYFVKYGVDLEN